MNKVTFKILFLLFLLGCIASNRINVYEKGPQKSIRLTESPKAFSMDAKGNLSKQPEANISTIYWYMEKPTTRPEITADFNFNKLFSQTNLDSVIFIMLDNENIKLIASTSPKPTGEKNLPLSSSNKNGPDTGKKLQVVIPENLWIPIIHAHNIGYKISAENKEVVIQLNKPEKVKLIEFLMRSIKYKDEKFPAIPKGQKKW